MTSWAEFRASAPDLADTVFRTFALGRHATMATVQRDGAPRISGTEVEFADDGNIYLGMMPGAKRAADLRRDPRVAVHCPTHDPPASDPAGWLGDGKLSATAVEVESHRFRLDLERVVLTKVAPDGQRLQIRTWSARTRRVEVVYRS